MDRQPVTLQTAVRRCYAGRLRQRELASAIGVHQSKVSKWATGTMKPSLEEIRAMEDACDRPRGFVLALTGYVTAAGLAEGLRALAEVFEHGAPPPGHHPR